MTVTPYLPTSNNGVATVADQSSQGVARIVQWAQAAEAAHQLAEVLCRTAFCPEQFRDEPGNATAAILAGGEVGLSPLAALNGFDVIQGRSAPRAITLRAIVLSFGHEVELVESTPARCVMRGRRRGSEKWQQVTWDITRAKNLGLTGKKNWREQPTAMLQARATGEICRLVAADAILGIGYTIEEYQDQADEQPDTGRRKVQRQTKPTPELAAPTTTPAAPAEPDEDDLLGEGDTTEPRATAEQLKALGIQWTRLGVTDKLERHTYTGLLAGHDIGGTTKNLSQAEAASLLVTLRSLADRDALEAALDDLEQPELVPGEPYATRTEYNPDAEPESWKTEEPKP